MRGREFLDLAREVVGLGAERHRRGAHVHAYYALFLEARDALVRWGVAVPPHQPVHAQVRLKFTYASDRELNAIGLALDALVQRRAWASYQLGGHPRYATEASARQSIAEAADALARLDALEADPARLKAATASLPP